MPLLLIIGGLFLAPAYLYSLENRLQRDKTFHPFAVFTNFKLTTRARRFFGYIGLLIWVAAACFYLMGPTVDLSGGDTIRVAIMAMLVWQFMCYGHCRELEFARTGNSTETLHCVKLMKGQDGRTVTVKGSLDTLKIIAVFVGFYLVKNAV